MDSVNESTQSYGGGIHLSSFIDHVLYAPKSNQGIHCFTTHSSCGIVVTTRGCINGNPCILFGTINVPNPIYSHGILCGLLGCLVVNVSVFTMGDPLAIFFDDRRAFQQLYEEANDHLHNLVQLSIEMNAPSSSGMVLEISSEVLANALKFLHELPGHVERTTFYSS